MKTFVACTMAALFCLVTAGCTESTTTTVDASEAVNTVCPIMLGKIDGTTSTDWNGKKIGFCCPPCVDEWNSLTDEEKTEALAKAESGESHGEHGDHAEHGDHGEHEEHGETSAEDANTEGAVAPEAAADEGAETPAAE